MINSSRFTFIANALAGEGVFRPQVTYDVDGKAIDINGTSALVQYPRESDEKFARRNEVAWYENHLLSSCRRFVGYLSKKPPFREVANPLLEQVSGDCNWRGDDIDVFFQGFMVEAKARGSMLLLVDMPAALPATQADQMAQRVVPYFVPIKPEDVSSYELDIRGRLSLIEIHYQENGERCLKGWDTKSWWIKKNGKISKQEDHGLGVCPVLVFSENGAFPYVGDFAQIADISRRLFNARSELDEILRAQTFSLLHYHIPKEQTEFKAADIAEAVGTHNMLIHRGDAPGFIAPPDGPAKVYIETIGKLEEAIKRVALVVESDNGGTQESGIALAIRFQALNSSLTAFARRMEDFERRAWEVACLWLNLPKERVTLEWAKDYQIADLKTELEVLGAMQASGFPDEAIQQQQKQIAALAFSTSDDGELQVIIDAIDQKSAEIPLDPNADPLADPLADPALAPAAAPAAPQAPAVDLAPVESRLASIEAKLDRPAPAPAPVFEPVDLTPAFDKLAAAIDAMVALQTKEPPPAPAPQPERGKVIQLQFDPQGNPTGAIVRQA